MKSRVPRHNILRVPLPAGSRGILLFYWDNDARSSNARHVWVTRVNTRVYAGTGVARIRPYASSY